MKTFGSRKFLSELQMSRKRLAQWVDEEGVTRYGIRFQPFWVTSGTYGYSSQDPRDEQKEIEGSIFGLLSFLSMWTAAFAVDIPGALAIVPFGFLTGGFLSEDNWWKFAYGEEPGNRNMTWPQRITALLEYRTDDKHGISGVVSVMAGYLGASYIFDKDARKLWLPLVGAGTTLFGNIMTLMSEVKGLETNHYAHFGGMGYGFLFGWLVKRYWRKKTHGVGFLRRNDLYLTLFIISITYYLSAFHFTAK